MELGRGAEQREGGLVGLLLGGRWRIARLIGRGGMSTVYEARQDDATSVAIKIPNPLVTDNPRARARFLREAQVANFVGHPSAVRVLGSGTDPEGRPFLVMELLEGQTLRERRVAQGGRLGVAEVLRVGEHVLDVLIAAHEKAIIHRDVKPDNVFLTRAGEVKVLDFGIAAVRDEALADAQLTESGVSLGTPAFMAPEQARGRHSSVDGRTDVWSLGATMFLCLSGRHVHDEASTANEALIFSATQRAPALSRFCPDVPSDVARIVDRALALDPRERWQSAREMRDAVSRASLASQPPGGVLATLDRAAPTEDGYSPVRYPRARRPSMALLAALCATAGAAVIVRVRATQPSFPPATRTSAVSAGAPVPGPDDTTTLIVTGAPEAHSAVFSRPTPPPVATAPKHLHLGMVTATPRPSDSIPDDVLDRRK